MENLNSSTRDLLIVAASLIAIFMGALIVPTDYKNNTSIVSVLGITGLVTCAFGIISLAVLLIVRMKELVTRYSEDDFTWERRREVMIIVAITALPLFYWGGELLHLSDDSNIRSVALFDAKIFGAGEESAATGGNVLRGAGLVVLISAVLSLVILGVVILNSIVEGTFWRPTTGDFNPQSDSITEPTVYTESTAYAESSVYTVKSKRRLIRN